jgi:hypothetical protein
VSGRLLPAVLAVLAAVAAWLTPGLQAVVDADTRARVGGLPAWWLLAALVAGFAGAVLGRRLPAGRLWPLALTAFVCLPWLPGAVPPAFLIWQGPMATLVWILVAIGLAAPFASRLTHPALVDARRAPWIVAAVVASASLAGAWTLRGILPEGDEPHYLVISQSLLLDRDLRIENNHQRGDYTEYRDVELKPDYLQRGSDGQIYSIHAPGVSVAVAPAFAIAGWPGAVATVIALAAATAALIWLTAWRLTGSAGAAWVAAAAFSLTAPGYFHAFTIFPDGPGALLVAVGLWALVQLERGRALSLARLAGAGAALALLPWLHTRFSLIAGTLGMVLVVRLAARSDRVRAWSAFAAVPVVSALAWFAFFWLIWGTPNPAAPYGRDTQSALAHLQPSLPGLLADQQFGLIPNAPVYAAALAGMIALGRWHPRLAVELAIVIVPYVLAVGTYRMWWAGLSAPVRFLVAILPALTLPLAVAWSRSGPARRAVVLVLLAVSGCMVAARTFVGAGTFLYNVRDGHDLLLDWANRSVNLPLAFPSLHRDIVSDALGDIAIWLVTWIVMTSAGLLAARRTRQYWTCASAAVLLTVSVAASVVWAGSASSVTPTSSALELLRHWPETPRAIGWQSQPFGLTPPESVPSRLALASTNRGPRPRGVQPLFTAALVPGGRYDIHVEGAQPRGQLSIRAGRSTQLIDTLTLDGRSGSGVTGTSVMLPLLVESLTIEGDEAARTSVGRLTLVPATVGNVADAPRRQARRASRYGRLRVFFLDENAFMEPPGFWTRGRAATDLFVDAPEDGALPAGPPPAIRVRAGAAPVDVMLSSLDWRIEMTLEPGASQEVSLPKGRTSGWPLRIETSGGFRPAEHDPGSQDWRNLGVWIENVN